MIFINQWREEQQGTSALLLKDVLGSVGQSLLVTYCVFAYFSWFRYLESYNVLYLI